MFDLLAVGAFIAAVGLVLWVYWVDAKTERLFDLLDQVLDDLDDFEVGIEAVCEAVRRMDPTAFSPRCACAHKLETPALEADNAA